MILYLTGFWSGLVFLMKFSNLKNFAGPILKVREDEWRSLLTLTAIFFLLFTCLIYGRSIRTSLFLKTYGIKNLPLMYLLTYVVLAIVSTIYTALVDRFDKARLLTTSSIFFSGLFIVSKFFIVFPPFIIFIFVAVEINSILTIIQFWAFADIKYTGREAKRLFPLIMLFGLFSAAIAGMGMPFVLRIIQVNNIFIFLGILMFMNYLILRRLTSEKSGIIKSKAHYNKHEKGESPLKEYIQQIKEGFVFIAHSKFMLSYTGMTMSLYLVNGVIEYEFANAAGQSFASLTDLTQYFGLVQAGATFLAFLTQLFLTTRVIEAFGIPVVLSFYPVAIFIAISAMTSTFGLITSSLSKVTNDLFLYSIHDTVSSLLLNPIPEKLRGRARIFIQGITRPLAAIISSLYLIYATRELSTRTICMTALTVIVVWFYASRKIANKYLGILVDNLKEGDIDLKKYSMQTLSKLQSQDMIESLSGILHHKDQDDKSNSTPLLNRIFSAQLLYNIGSSKSLSSLTCLINDSCPQLKVFGLKAIRSLKSNKYVNEVIESINHPSPDIRMEAIDTYKEISEAPANCLTNLMEKEDDPAIKGALIKALVKLGGPAKENSSIKIFLDMLISSKKDKNGICASNIIAEMKLLSYGSYLTGLLKNKNEKVIDAAIKALGSISFDGAIPCLVPFLSDGRFSIASYEALLKYRHRVIPYFKTYLLKSKGSVESFSLIISLLGELGDENAGRIVANYIKDSNEKIRLTALNALYKLQNTSKKTYLSKQEVFQQCKDEIEETLKTIYLQYRLEKEKPKGGCKAYRLLLRERFNIQKEILLILIRLARKEEVLTTLNKSLRSRSKKTLDYALEALETLLPYNIRRHFMLIFEELPLHEKTKTISNEYGFDSPSIESILVDSAKRGSMMERLCSIYDLGEIKNPKFINIFTQHKDFHNQNIREAALLGISRLKK